MLAVYNPPRRRSQDSDSTIELERVIPAGAPYLTKVNGKLVMARDKRSKAANVAVDLLGEAFGTKTRIIRKRAKSLDKPNGPLLIGGVPYVPQQQIGYTPYTTPLPQQAFSSPNLVPYPSQPSFILPNPSQQDLNQLQQMQAHFSKMYGPEAPNNTANTKVEVTKTTITITKHICAGCGRIRSKKYHHDHPLKEGEKPEPDFCRKFQKDSSSTDSEGESRQRKRMGKKGKNAKHKRHHTKSCKYSRDEEDANSPTPKAHTKPKHHAKKEPKRVPSEEYIIVEEEILEDSTPRPRGRVRERFVEKIEIDRYPSGSRPSSQRPRSTSRKGSYNIPRKPVRPAKVKETVVRETIRRRSPSIEYRYVDVGRKSPVLEERVETYPRKIPVHFYDDLLHEDPPHPRDTYREHGNCERGSSGKAYSVEEVETVSRDPSSRGYYERGEPEKAYIVEEVETEGRRGPSREYYEEREVIREPPLREYHGDQDALISSRAEEARQRRRRERNSPTSVTPPWEAPHVIHPTGKEDLIAVTERYEYRPKKRAGPEEDRRRQEYVDRVTLDRHQTSQFELEEAARYYHEDWSRAEPEPPREPLRRVDHHGSASYRRDRQKDAELSDSEASYEYRTGRGNVPRAPTPPSGIYHTNNAENWQDRQQPPYPLSSDSEVPQRLNNLRREKGYEPPHNMPRGHERSRSTSRARRAYVQETTGGGTERASPSKALIPPPRRSGELEREAERYVEFTTSELAERERIAESEARHVTFRETPTMLSMQNSWTETSELGPVHPETTGSGWGHGAQSRDYGGWNHGFESAEASGWNH